MSRIILALLCLTTVSGWSTAQGASSASHAPRIVGYYASWAAYGGYTPAQIPGELLTHVIYAFANISGDGEAILGDACQDVGSCNGQIGAALQPGSSFAQMRELKKRYPHLRVLVAVGGWNWSGKFSDVALTPESRSRFVTSALTLFLDRWPGLFDGFDLDWEYPFVGGRPENKYRPDDWQNYALLLAEFRRQLDARGTEVSRRYLLTIAAPASVRQAIEKLVWTRISNVVDWINLMTYDYNTGGRLANFNAPLFAVANDPAPGMNVHATVERYLAAGVPREKIMMGLPFFGHGYSGVKSESAGLFQSAEPDLSNKQWGVGTVSFRELRSATARRFKRFWHPEAQVPWLFNDEKRVWISYDDSESITRKLDYVRSQGLGGVMIWELSGDDGSLLPAIHRQLRTR